MRKELIRVLNDVIQAGDARHPEDELLPHLKTLREKVSRDNGQLTKEESQCLTTVKFMIQMGY